MNRAFLLPLLATAFFGLSGCESDEEIDDVEHELQDRFGKLPAEATSLLYSVRVRLIAARIRLARVTLEAGRLNIALPPQDDAAFYELHFQQLMSWVLSNKDRANLEQDTRQVRIIVQRISTPEDVRDLLVEFESIIQLEEITNDA